MRTQLAFAFCSQLLDAVLQFRNVHKFHPIKSVNAKAQNLFD